MKSQVNNFIFYPQKAAELQTQISAEQRTYVVINLRPSAGI
ncbi:hypothetical protein [Runella sp. SP2]|nr:hypothetical protein [Runella sp. SP2]